MFRAHGREAGAGAVIRRSLVATVLAAAGVLAAAAPGAADGNDGPSGEGAGATATLKGLAAAGAVELKRNGRPEQVQAGLFNLDVAGTGTLQTYCIDVFNPTQPQARYQETPWKQSSLHDNRDAGRINWILQNSYPQVKDLAALGKAAGTGPLTKEQAAAGTQAAIWRFSDHIEARAKDPAADKLATYLEKAAEPLQEPRASLAFDKPAVSGKSGEKLGPLTVTTSASGVRVGLDSREKDVKLVDADGKPVTTASNGTRLYVDVPKGTAAGTAKLSAEATATVPVGRVFTGIGQNRSSQTMILAGSTSSTVTAAASANWSADAKAAVPSVEARQNCDKGTVDITATNKGGTEYTFSVAGKQHTVKAGGSVTVPVPVADKQTYDIKVTLPGGEERRFQGVLDCRTVAQGTTGGTGGKPSAPATPATSSPDASPSAGTAGGGSGKAPGGDLATTGASATTVAAGIGAAVLLAVGAGAVVLGNRRKARAGK